MSALRKAGVWLGLVEEVDEQVEGVFDDEFGEDDDDYAPPARPRSLARPTQRTAERDSDYRESRVDGRGRPAPRIPESRGFDARGAEPRGAEPRGAEPRGAEPRGAEPRGAEPRGAVARDFDSRSGTRGFEEPGEAEGLEARGSGARGQEARGHDGRGPDGRYERGLDREARAEWPPREETPRGERGSVRQLSRATPPAGVSYPTQDNLALAPQVQLRERAVVSDDTSRRYQITTLHPTTYSEARTIGEHFRDGHPVIMNLTEMDEPDAKRLVDFAAGLAFGLRGSMERVTNRVFLLSPPNIQVSAEDKAKIAEAGFFDQG